MTNKDSGGGGGPGGEVTPKPILNDRVAGDAGDAGDDEKDAEAVRKGTGGAIDVDAAHDRSS